MLAWTLPKVKILLDAHEYYICPDTTLPFYIGYSTLKRPFLDSLASTFHSKQQWV